MKKKAIFLIIFSMIYLNNIFVIAYDTCNTSSLQSDFVKSNFKDESVTLLIDNTYDEYIYFDYYGRQKGIVVDLVKQIKKNTGINFAIKYKSNFEKIENDISEKNYDVYFGVPKIEKLVDNNYISDNVSYNNLYVYTTNKLNSVTELRNKKIGFLNKYDLNLFVQNYNFKEFSYSLETSYNVLLGQLKTGLIDAIITDKEFFMNKDYIKHYLKLSLKKEVFFAINKDNTELYHIINNEINKYKENGFIDEIIDKNNNEFAFRRLGLTKNEINWLKNHIQIPIAVTDNYQPYEDITRNGEYVGLTSKYLKNIEQILGVKFELLNNIQNYNFSELFQMIQKGEAYLMPSVVKNKTRERDFLFTDSYYYNDLIIISNNTKIIKTLYELEGTTVAIPRDYWIDNYLNLNLKKINKIYVDNEKEALQLVNNNKAEYTFTNNVMANEIIKNIKDNKLQIVGKFDIRLDFHFAVSKKYPELVSILNKAIESLNYYSVIREKELLDNNYSSYKIYINILLIIVGILLICFIGLVLLININKNRQNLDIIAQKNLEKYQDMIYKLVDTLEEASILNDFETGTHTRRVSYYCEIIARELGKDQQYVDEIMRYASLHDVGKIGVSSNILKKPGKLTKDEFELMKQHVKIGTEIIYRLNLEEIATNIVRYHHENWDGSGYLEGLKGEDIPLEARIMSIADVYDALRMERVYKAPFSHEQATSIIISEKGKKFDPALVEIFEKNHKAFAMIYDFNIVDVQKQ